MRKITLTMGCAFMLVVNTFAQGTVSWTISGGLFIAQTNGTVYSPFSVFSSPTPTGTQGNTFGNSAANNTALGYQGYHYELLVGSSPVAPSAIAQLVTWIDTGLSATNRDSVANNGRIIQMADDGVANNTQATANDWLAGVTTNVILVGWSANLGNTWAAALASLQNFTYVSLSTPGYFGVSSVGNLAANGGNPGVFVFGSNPGQINNPADNPMQLFVLYTPEPGTLALALFGGASLLLFRRRK